METRTYTAQQQTEMLRREESHFLDFKRASITPGKLQETVVALANADGGEIIIGLDDDIRRSPIDRFYGFPTPEHANNHVSVADILVDPPVPAVAAEFIVCPTAPSHMLLHLLIPKSPMVHYTADKTCFIRKGAQNLVSKARLLSASYFPRASDHTRTCRQKLCERRNSQNRTTCKSICALCRLHNRPRCSSESND